ncbi:gamma-glutamylputrescine synthetase [Vibrio sp. 10N.286.49.C2]|uniref:glutamine synthetase family protein n=1 Tax=unclassified Vibrio TaxID=2614977 RepID=UPI000C82DEB2|nr:MULTISPECIES: glutamine synthetase family protein [unclassified Vibrio]PMH26471.1 gamma-glutamylputrescine synthetase [Vibrio sp. 10N.286.49.C2]PMH54805.1 gamma-glutamylputrescine synthetase [Vibrio sp. 10N.286.49.B1]PMH83981.1 gamma-glutamylputrescine synthetase [Vibrio sp. 10N.286.48.B7]
MEAYLQEVKNFRQKWPTIEYVDLIFTDLNGTPRGKRIPVNALDKLAKGVALPLSTITLDTKGAVVESAGLGEDLGEPDNLCFPVLGSLLPTAKSQTGQVLLSMMEDDGKTPHHLFIRNIIERMLGQLHSNNQFPVVALELEFYLIDKVRGENGELQTAINPTKNRRERDTEVYDVDGLDDYADFLADLNNAASEQGLNTAGALSESAPGQFEINFNHSQDVLRVCDEIIFSKRLIKQVAHKHGFDATFMAKPFLEEAGNGQHMHLSLVDSNGDNLFTQSDDSASPLFYQTLTAMLSHISDAMALLCPNVNSYRRFVPGAYVPTKADWGENHRGVALRIPISDGKNRRIEHRIAGADVNPYILAAVVLSAVLASKNYNQDQCPPALSDNAVDLPTRMSDALTQLESSELGEYFSKDFIDLYLACKRSELVEFERIITPLEIDWMLHSA